MERIFYNINGNVYFILFGGKGLRSFLVNVEEDTQNAKYVICAILEQNSWWQGTYYESFAEAYEDWRKK